MNVVKRAWLYVTRQKVKSLILFLILTIAATFVLTGISIQNSAGEAAKNVRTSVGGVIKLELDRSGNNYTLAENTGQNIGYQYSGDKITEETIEALMNVKGVIDYNAVSLSGFFGAPVDFELLPTGLGGFSIQGGSDYGLETSMTVALSSERFSGFTSGRLSLKDGRHISKEDDHVIMISDELASHNNLSVGDKIQVYSMENNKIIELEIVGTFTGTEGYGEDALLPSDRAGNQGIVDFGTKLDAYGEAYNFFDNLDIYVEDPKSIQNVYNQISALPEVKGKSFQLSIESEEYNVIANPLDSMQDLVQTLIIVIIIVSIALLTLLLALWIRNRSRETGILMSFGIGKGQIIGQFAVEVILIAVVAFALSYFSSNLIAGKASSFIMAQVVDTKNSAVNEEEESELGVYSSDSFDQLSGAGQKEAKAADFKVIVSMKSIILVYVLGVGIILTAVLLSSYSVLRFKPKEILDKMS